MRLFLGRKQIDPHQVDLDRVRWDQPNEKKAARLVPLQHLYVELLKDDLAALSEKLHRSYRQILEKEPDFFKDDIMEDVPRPANPKVFLEKPLKLKGYLRRDSWWREETVLVLMGMINPWRTGDTRYWIEEFQDVKVDGDFTILVFGARPAGAPAPKVKLDEDVP